MTCDDKKSNNFDSLALMAKCVLIPPVCKTDKTYYDEPSLITKQSTSIKIQASVCFFLYTSPALCVTTSGQQRILPSVQVTQVIVRWRR